MFRFFTRDDAPAPPVQEVNVDEEVLSIFGKPVQHAETGQVGILRSVGISPFYAEEKDGVVRAYVVALDGEPRWADYWLPKEVIEVV